CGERDIITQIPTDHIRPPHPEVKRDRVLSDEEIRHLLLALEAEQSIFGPLLLILLLTGQRRAEVAGMLWSELRDLDKENALWEIPGSRTKNKQTHLVPLSPLVLAVIRRVPRVSPLVFTTTGRTPVSGFGRAKVRLDTQIANLRRASGLN